MKKVKRYVVTQGAYQGCQDDVVGRYYVVDTHNNIIDKRGSGWSRTSARWMAAQLNAGRDRYAVDMEMDCRRMD